ncbi:MAG: pyridoxine 5'-phosphate synthase, partial [Pseudomonadota bacterium]|nr:pyridoxine 5'-phosphate synthase [Pseudomonadota bacterium]
LAVANAKEHFEPFVRRLSDSGIKVSLFIEPDIDQINAAVDLGAAVVELHTGAYCEATGEMQETMLQRIVSAAEHAEKVGIECHAGHGLTFDNVTAVAAIPTITELNIGHFLIGEAIFGGIESAIKHMRSLMDQACVSLGGQPSV